MTLISRLRSGEDGNGDCSCLQVICGDDLRGDMLLAEIVLGPASSRETWERYEVEAGRWAGFEHFPHEFYLEPSSCGQKDVDISALGCFKRHVIRLLSQLKH